MRGSSHVARIGRCVSFFFTIPALGDALHGRGAHSLGRAPDIPAGLAPAAARGALGKQWLWLVSSEWLHYGYAVISDNLYGFTV
jgi:hypothetical protein